MTIGIKAEIVCDICGTIIKTERYSFQAHAVMPEIKERAYNFMIWGIEYNLCGPCGTPVKTAFSKRVEELQEERRLVGIKSTGPD